MCYTESNSGTWHFCGIFPAMEQKVEGWVIMKKILFVASEAVPFIKTGGLADVVGSLPKCFDKEYFDVRVMIPKYLCIKDKFLSNLTYVNHFYMDYLGQSRYVGILEYVYEGITFYFIDNEYYFSGGWPYGDHSFYFYQEPIPVICKEGMQDLISFVEEVNPYFILYIDIYGRYTGMPMQDDHTCYLHMFHVSVNIKQCPKGRGKRRSDESTF